MNVAQALEAILFVADEPLPSVFLAEAIGEERRVTEDALEALQRNLEEQERGIVLREIAGGWRLYSSPDAREAVERFVLASRHTRMTKAALETLSIVAYKQPVTRHQIAAIRGVNSDGVLKSLIDRGLLLEVGREDVPGRPVLYGTTPEFLERLGLPSLSALPSLAPLLDAVDEESGDAVGGVDSVESALDEPDDDAIVLPDGGQEPSPEDLADAEEAGDL